MESHRLEAALAPLLAAGLVARAGATAFDARPAGSAAAAVVTSGAPALDSWLPAGGLARAGLHEFVGLPLDPGPLALALICAARSDGPIVWIRLAGTDQGLPYAFGLGQAGFDPDRLILVEAPKARDALWATEESLRAGCAGAVLLEGVAPDLTAQRRLLLAAEQGDGPALAAYDASKVASSSAATTRFRVTSEPAAQDASGIGAPRWSITLERNRGGRTGRSLLLEWDEAARTLREARDVPLHKATPVAPAAEPLRKAG